MGEYWNETKFMNVQVLKNWNIYTKENEVIEALWFTHIKLRVTCGSAVTKFLLSDIGGDV